MKRLSTALVVAAFAASASATDIYQGLATGNADLYPHNVVQPGSTLDSEMAGVQPGVGDSFSGIEERSRGLFGESGAARQPAKHPDIYGSFGSGNLDLY